MANDIDKTSPHYKGEFGSIYEVNQKFPNGGVSGDYVEIDGWAHYWNADRGTWCVNAQRDSYWDELITGIINKLKLFKGATYMGVAGVSTVPEKIAGVKMYYFANAAGTYSGFGGLQLAQGINVLYTDNGTSWTATPLLEVAQELGVSTEKVMSQKAVNTELGKKANAADIDTKFTEEKERVDAELDKKFDNKNIAHEFGDSEDKVVSQFALPFREIESPEFLHCIVDAEDHFLFGIQLDGSIEWSKGIPTPIRAKLHELIYQCQQDKIDLTEAINSAKEELMARKVDKEEGKSLIEDEVKKCFKIIENEEFIYAVVDSEVRLLFGIYRDSGKPYFPLNAMYHISQNEEFLWVVLDEANHPLLGIRKDGSVDWAIGIPSPIRKELSDLHRKTNLPEVINRNRIQESRVYAAARCNTYKNTKDFQLCLVGDPHDPYSKGTQNAVEVTNYFRSIEAMLVLGDIQGWTPYDRNTNPKDRNGIEPFVDILDKCIKPWYLVVGNHDVGPCRYIPFARSHQQVWEDLIKPMVDRGFLRSNEINSSNDYASKCYYYHDFNSYKVRLIVLYEYGFPLEIEDSNEYWETIDYDESAMDMQLGTTYTYDANKPIVCNCSRYKEHSFKLKKSVTTPYVTTKNDGTMPQYKFRQLSFFTKEQMEWLASVLTSTPDGYGVIIASHQSLIAPCILTDNKFSRGITPDNVSPRQDGLSADMAMNVAIVPKIVDAWIKKKSISERIVASNRSGANEGNIEYLNTETDSEGKYAYMLNLDFSDRINNNAYFINYIAGHEHNDSIEQSVDYPSQKAIIVTTPNPPYRWMSDTATVDDPNSQAYDSLTIYSCNKDRIALVKYGDDITINGIKRDFEIIKL